MLVVHFLFLLYPQRMSRSRLTFSQVWRLGARFARHYGTIYSGPQIFLAQSLEIAWLHAGSDAHAGARHWSEFQHLQRHQRRSAQGSAVSEAKPVSSAVRTGRSEG